MEESFLQGPLYLLMLIFSGLTAILGFTLVHHLSKKESKGLFSGSIRFIFTALAIGYSFFALAELSWYLIFDVFKQLPSVSMPDFYWVVGDFFLLLGFITFSAYMHKQHGSWSKSTFLIVLALILFSGVIFFLYSMDLSTIGEDSAKMFLGYFYPLISSAILIASANVYLFFDQIDQFKASFLLFLTANIAFLSGDLLYVYYLVKGGYGLVGIISDSLYVVAYLLCSWSFLMLVLKIREHLGSMEIKPKNQ